MQQKNINNLIENALAIELKEAKEAGALGYMGRALVQATMERARNNFRNFHGE